MRILSHQSAACCFCEATFVSAIHRRSHVMCPCMVSLQSGFHFKLLVRRLPRGDFSCTDWKMRERRWTLGFVSVCMLLGQQASASYHHRRVHSDEDNVIVEHGALKSTDGRVYFSVRKPPQHCTLPAQDPVRDALEAYREACVY